MVIAVILSLTSVLFAGARVLKADTDQTSCIMTISDVQMSLRTFQESSGYSPGGTPFAEVGSRDIAVLLLEKGFITEKQFSGISGDTTCPSGGIYHRDSAETFPQVGKLYIRCSLEESQGHVPTDGLVW